MENLNDDQTYPFHFLKKSHDEGKLVHGYLFFGGQLDEKMRVAKKFAKMILGTDDMTQRLIDDDEHANVMIIKPDGKNIKKEQIVFLKTEISKKSIEDRAKIYIIESVEKMSTAATNSLLKFLEEPAADVYMILIAPSKEALLPTITSRTVNLFFGSTTSSSKGIEPLFQDVIDALEAGHSPHVIMGKNPTVFKEQIHEFLDAFTQHHQNKLEMALKTNHSANLKACVKQLRAIDHAKRHLGHNMNVGLCLDQMWIKMGM